ncbi:MAG: cobalamin B12-binding domain-containing protein, partial [Armatimonadetes bacterium]|nr:cobalamin B12-binding domain-containing protein [Armatimonadota bacterium]
MTFRNEDVFGLVRPSVDVHTLGISLIADLLRDCGYRVVIADEQVCEACNTLDLRPSVETVERWIRENRISRLGFSYRLDAEDGVLAFERFHQRLRERLLLANQGGPVRRMFFAGLPAACDIVRSRFGNDVPVFHGDESPAESLRMLGVPESNMPPDIAGEPLYDKARMEFARTLVADGRYTDVQPVDRSGYRNFGTEHDGLADRVAHGVHAGLPPLMRAHVGPYGPNREEAVRLFTDWAYRLASSGMLDVLSIGTSQLTQ